MSHLVQHAIEDKGSPPKEYSIGIDVFDRGESFDPRIDTIVRVQSRRLRAKLAEYYAVEGQTDPILIEVPKGQYLARFSQSSDQNPPLNRPGIVEPGRDTEAEASSRAPGMMSDLPLATRRTQLIGRENELAVVKRLLLVDRVRLVTLWGAGGVGKTRLAVETASRLADYFPGGVYFVALAGIFDPGMVASALAQAFCVRQVSGKSLTAALREYVQVKFKTSALVVIDNVEHVLEATPLFGELLDASDALHVLVTSQAVPHLYGEHAVAIPPLPTPDLKSLPELSELAARGSSRTFWT